MTRKLVRSVLNESSTVLINDCNFATSLHQTKFQTDFLTYLLIYTDQGS